MKKLKTLSAILFTMLATVILGACSCSSSQVSVLRITTDVQEVQAIVDDVFEVGYTILPKEATNTRVTLSTGNTEIVKVNGSTVVSGQQGKGTFLAVSPGSTTIKFTTDDGGYVAEVRVTVYPDPSPLTNPTNLKYDNATSKVTWDTVEGAVGYYVNINGTDYITNTNSYDGKGTGQLKLESGVEYSIKVRTQGDKYNYKDALDYTDPIIVYFLDTPRNVSAINGVVTWDAVDRATNYIVTINGQTYVTTATTVDLKLHQSKLNASNAFEYNVIADSTSSNEEEGLYVVTSVASKTDTITWLQAPNVINYHNDNGGVNNTNSTANWNAITGAQSYIIVVDDNEPFTAIYNEYQIPSEVQAGGHTITITAVGDPSTTISGETLSSAEFEFTKLPSVTSEINGDILTIDYTALNEEDAKNFIYELYFAINNNLTKVVRLENTLEFNLTNADIAEGGNYSVYIYAIAPNGSSYVNGIYATQAEKSYFVKLQYACVSAISKTGVISFNTVANASEYEITLDTQTLAVPIANDNVTVSGDTTTINLNFDTINTSTLNAGEHTIRIIPKGERVVSATATSCATFAFTKLTKSANYSLNNQTGKVTWDVVARNSGYDVTFNDSLNSNIITNSFTPNPAQLALNNTFSVVALGNNKNIINSDAYEFEIARLEQISGVKIEDGLLTWDNSDAKYNISIYYGGVDSSKITYSTEINSYELSSSGNYDVSLTQSKAGYFTSAETTRYHLNQLSRPNNIALVKGETNLISFDNVNNASSYVIEISLNGSLLVSSEIDTNSYQLNDKLASGTYTVKVLAKGDKLNNFEDNSDYNAYVNSKYSANYTFIKLATPTDITKSGTLTWKIATTNATAGSWVVGIEGYPNQVIPTSSNRGSYSFATYNNGTSDVQLPSGDYTVTLQALASTTSSGNNVLDSDIASVGIVTKLATITPYVTSGIIIFDNIDNATSYTVEYSNDGTSWSVRNSNVVTKLVGTTTQVTVTGLDGGKLRVRTNAGDGYITSNYSDVLTFAKLNNVENFTKTNTTLAWSKVDNSTGYYLSNNVSTYVKDITSADTLSDNIDNPTSAGSFIYSIYAKGSTFDKSATLTNAIYLTSDTTTLEVVKLQQITGLAINSGVISWNAYVGVTSKDVPIKLQVAISGDAEFVREITNINQNQIDLSTLTDDEGNLLQEGSYNVTFTYIGNNNDILNSSSYTFQNTDLTTSIVRVASPNLTVENGVIVWELVDGLTNYSILIKETETTDNYVTLTSSQYSFTISNNKFSLVINTLKADTNYSIKVVTIANTNQLNSVFSEELTICKLGKVTNFAIQNTNFVWDANVNSQYYNIVNITTSEVIVDNSTNGTHSAVEKMLTPGTYQFKMKAMGTKTYTGSGVAYLEGEYSDTIDVVFVDKVQEISLNSNVLTWKTLAGISNYNVQLISDGVAVRNRVVGTNSCSLDYFDSDLTSGAYNSFAVSAISTNEDMFIIPNYESSDLLSIYKAPAITELRIEQGMLAWDINKDYLVSYYMEEKGITSMSVSDYSNLVQLINDILTGVITTGDDIEIFRPFYSFTINSNGVEIDITPGTNTTLTDFVISADGASIDKASFYYAIDEEVTKFTNYTFKVRANGNASSSDAITKALGSTYSSTINAIKTLSPETTVLSNGNIKFTLLTKVEEVDGTSIVTGYVDKYVITATPQATSDGILGTKKTRIITADVNPVTPDYEYSYYLMTPDDKGDYLLTRNVKYSIVITSLGTVDSRTEDGNVFFLRSTNYNTQIITFLDKVQNVKYIDTDQQNGGMMIWTPITGTEQTAYVITSTYHSTKDGYTGTLAEWINAGITSGDIITYSVPAGTGNFTFTEVVEDKAIPSGNYVFGIKAIGDGRTTIESDEIDFVEFTKLPATDSVLGYSWLSNGVFTWQEVPNCLTYKVVVVETLAGGGQVEYDPEYVATNYYDLSTDIGQVGSTFALKVTPLGATYLGINYVSGYQVTTTAYSRLATPVMQFSIEENMVSWQTVANAGSYQLQLNDAIVSITNGATSYVFDQLTAGSYPITVRAMSDNSNYLHGVFADLKTIVKLDDAVLQVVSTNNKITGVLDAGYISWKAGREDDTLVAGKVKVDVYSSNSSGAVGTFISTEILDSETKTYDISALSAGYYKVFVTFINDESDTEKYTLPSNPVGITVYKLTNPSPMNGTYYEPEDIANKETSFNGNYLEWQLVTVGDYVEKNYFVKIYEVNNSIQDTDPTYQYDTINNPELFELYPSSNSTKMFFDISWLNMSVANIYVGCIGDVASQTTLVNPNVIGYTRSSFGMVTIEIPTEAPVIISTSEELLSGVIKWNNVYNADIEVKLIFDYNTLSSDLVVSQQLNKEYHEVLKAVGGVGVNEYHLPFVSNNYKVQIRYVLADYVSTYCNPVNASMTLFAYGAGTESDPYLLYSTSTGNDLSTSMSAQMQAIANYPNAHYKLLKNFSMVSDWKQITTTFNGYFDGSGNQISNIKTTGKDSNQNIAMFSTFGQDAVFTNTQLIFEISNNYTNQGDAGEYQYSGLVNTNNGVISYITMLGSYSAELKESNLYVGGIAVTNNGTITNVNSTLNITATSNKEVAVGGLVVRNYGIIADSKVSGTLTASTTSAIVAQLGGVVCFNGSADLITNTAVVSGAECTSTLVGNSVGGVASKNWATITGSSFSGSISASENQTYTIMVGGLVAHNIKGVINFSYAVLTIDTLHLTIDKGAGSSVGGLVGYSAGGTYSNCYTVFGYTTNQGASDFRSGSVCGQVAVNIASEFSNIYYNSVVSPVSSVTTLTGATQLTDTSTLPTGINAGSTNFRFVLNTEDEATVPYLLQK